MEDDKNIKGVIDRLLSSKSKFSHSYNKHTIEDIWRSSFGELISSYTSKVSYSNEVLTVYISSSPLKEEILMNKKNVIEKLNTRLQYRKIRDIIVR
ncbi:MAG: DUF721 domain-containing protein [Chitinophagia bacterium]|nr:DUF721 domain-containing protein [Chitinophagia bacterium]